MKIFAYLCMAVLASPMFATQSYADPRYEMEYTNETPLIVIRFNQRRVLYQKPLYTTISQALAAKPTASFDIVSVAPRAADTSNQARYNQLAAQNNQRVFDTLREIGLPQNRMNITTVVDNVDASEVRIFVH